MDSQQLVALLPRQIDPDAYRFGTPQQSGKLTVIPIFGIDRTDRFTSPLSGLKLNRVDGYGRVELHNPDDRRVAIVPLHMGYIQDKAQNHALCRSAFLAAGQILMFEDACCVQASQGGYLEKRDQWFFILPLQLRDRALELSGVQDYSKLWDDIAQLNTHFGLANQGHLEQIISRKRAVLTQYQSRLELLPGQTGALFLLDDKLVGVEIAPSVAYFQELWMPLVCFCYGVAAMFVERQAEKLDETLDRSVPMFAASNLQELRQELQQSRQQLRDHLSHCLVKTPAQTFEVKQEESFLSLTLNTAIGSDFSGQFVEEDGQLLYLSLYAKNS